MNRVGTVLLALLAPSVSGAQAPASADLWRLAATSLPAPAALEAGPTGTFWNAAAAGGPRLAAGVQLIETPDIVGVSGLVAGVAYGLSRSIWVMALAGRTDVSDLVRTTTSATSEQGEIPVYEQQLAVGGVVRLGSLRGGALVRGHDARFDADQNTGITADLGVRWSPVKELTLAAATHFFPIDFTDRATTDYFGGAEYQISSVHILQAPSRILGRYALSYREGNGFEHGAGLGLALDEWLRTDLLVTRELGYGSAEWRPSLGIGVRVGRYTITAARASGLNGLGATYRIGLDVEVIP